MRKFVSSFFSSKVFLEFSTPCLYYTMKGYHYLAHNDENIAPNGIDTVTGRLLVSQNQQILDNRGNFYTIIQFIDSGNFADCYAAIYSGNGSRYALKIMVSNSCDPSIQSQASTECHIYDQIDSPPSPDIEYIPHLYGYFEYQNHWIIVSELLGPNFLRLLKMRRYAGITFNLVQTMGRELGCALRLLHSHNFIHSDLKLENIVLTLDYHHVRLIDLAGSIAVEDARPRQYLVTRFYRPPEIVLGYPSTTAVDIWSLACNMFEVLIGYPLFPGENEIHLLGLIEKRLAPIPASFIESAPKGSIFYDTAGRLRNEKEWCQLYHKEVHQFEDNYCMSAMSDILRNSLSLNHKQKELLIDLLQKMLNPIPSERLTIHEVLEHPFFDASLRD